MMLLFYVHGIIFQIKKIDLFINSRSMMEMTNDTILSYFKQIHNLTQNWRLFFMY